MSDRKYTVDDIIGEIEMNKAMKERRKPASDLQRIDDVIHDILTRKKEEELQQENRVLTERERASLEREIKAQTRTLTKQFEKLKRERGEEPRKKEPEIRLAPVQKEQQVRARPAPAPQELPPERREVREQRYDELKRAANTQRLRMQMNEIAGHFGNFELAREADARLGQTSDEEEKQENRTEITPNNYREYKSNRSRKIESFVLDPERAKPEQGAAPERAVQSGQPGQPAESGELPRTETEPVEAPDEVEEETAQVQAEADEYLREDDYTYDYEYESPKEAEEIAEHLDGQRRSARGCLIGMGILSAVAAVLCFFRPGEAAMQLFGGVALPPFLFATVNLALVILAMAVGAPLFGSALRSMTRGYPSRDVLPLVAALVCFGMTAATCFQPEQLLKANVHLYTPIAVLMLFFAMLARYQTVARAADNFRMITDDEPKYAATHVSDLRAAAAMTKGVLDEEPVLARNVRAGFFENFLTHSFRYDEGDTLSRNISLVAVPLALVAGIAGYFVTKDLFAALTLICGILVLAGGFLCAVAATLPLRDAAGVVSRFGGVMPGSDMIDVYQETNSVLLEAYDLFPAKSIVLHGIKTFQGKRIDDAILDAASVVCASKSVFSDIFLGIINNKTGLLKKVDSIQYEDLMGLSAWVDEKRVLIGNRELLINHSIAVPKKSYEDKYHAEGGQVVYLATEGELCAAFIVEFTAEPGVADLVRLLEKYEMIAVVRTVDSSVTPDLLAGLFGTEEGVFKILPSRLHRDFEEQVQPCDRVDSMLCNDGSLLGYIVSLAMTKKLHTCIRLGTVLAMIGAVCGVTLLVTLFFLGRAGILGSAQLLIFLLIFPLIYWVYEKNMRI